MIEGTCVHGRSLVPGGFLAFAGSSYRGFPRLPAVAALFVGGKKGVDALLTFAYSTETVNGVPGDRVPGQGRSELPAPAGSQKTFVP
jgi:hypothetical protein